MAFRIALFLLLAFGPAVRSAAAQVPAASPEARVASFLSGLEAIRPLGPAAEKALRDQWREQKVLASRQVLRVVGRQLRDAAAPEKAPEAAEIEARARALSESCAALVEMGDGALAAVAAAREKAAGADRQVLDAAQEQLFYQIALREVARFAKDGASSGIFPGMFDAAKAHGAGVANGFLSLFADYDQPDHLRVLAGEGVAQLCGEAEQKAVRGIYDDPMEQPRIKAKAKEVLARLGDESLIKVDIERAMKERDQAQEALDRADAELREVHAKCQALEAVAAPTEEQKTELAALVKKRGEKDREVAQHLWGTGLKESELANIYLSVRVAQKSELHFERCLELWQRIQPLLRRNPRAQQQVSMNMYNCACMEAVQGKGDEAMRTLEGALRWGYSDVDWITTDGDMSTLWGREDFKKLLADVKSGEARKRWDSEDAERAKSGSPKPPDKPADG